MLLKNKTAIITGCNRGIGKAILEVFSAQGADVIACARKETPEFTEFLNHTVSVSGNHILPFYFDFAVEEDVKNAVRGILATKKKIDILVNNAGVASGSLFQMTSIKDLKNVFEINFFAQILFSQTLSRAMAKCKSGSIINIGSTAGLRGDPGTLSYGSSKAALMFATKTMATELGTSNVRVNAIAPGITKTDMFDQMDEKARTGLIENSALKRPAEAAEIANAAMFLASDLSSYITGQVLRVDGGIVN